MSTAKQTSNEIPPPPPPPTTTQVIGSRVSSNGAAITSEEDKLSSSSSAFLTAKRLLVDKGKDSNAVKAVVTIRRDMRGNVVEKIEDRWEHFVNGIGRGISLQLVSDEIDPETKSGKYAESKVKGWKKQTPVSDDPYTVEYAAEFKLPHEFGTPGAIVVTNLHRDEFFLVKIVVHGFSGGPLFFPAKTWIHPRHKNPESRIVFRNQAYLPWQTPRGMEDLRRKELLSIRGNDIDERKYHERIYDYDVYNDLGNPDNDDEDLARPVLGGNMELPYPRRCRTGRSKDEHSESRLEKPHPLYVPRDEKFGETKMATFAVGKLKAVLHNLVPSIASALSDCDIPFVCFSDIDTLFSDGFLIRGKAGKIWPPVLAKVVKKVWNASHKLMKYDTPAIIRSKLQLDRFSWLRDVEFGRQTLAGVNPLNIELLREFPIMSKLDPAIYGPQESALTKQEIESDLHEMSLEQAMEEKRLFILDYHDMILPFVEKINSLPGRKMYGSRTILYYSKSGFLWPVAIELSLPPTSDSPAGSKHVYTRGHDATSHWLWKLAKAHVCSTDAGVHQLVNHWLRTHACMEPYIIATHRQLSAMHPIHKLLHPHMRYTLEINALARQSLINGGGIIEASFGPGKYAVELSSAAYKALWRFDMEGLPADLVRRGMAEEDSSSPTGIKLTIPDYPYASDGLLIWSAIKELTQNYIDHFYVEPNSIQSDLELQSWWDEIITKGHEDKKSEPWWPKLETNDDLTSILTTMIWTASGFHAAINFGQYPFGGYVPNRPTLMRRLIPREDDPDYEEKFMKNPQRFFLASLPTKLQAGKVMAVQDTLSTHSGDEEYLGDGRDWVGEEDGEVKRLFERFSERVVEIEEVIHGRNKDVKLKNRSGAGVPPYELLVPSSGPGVTGRGIPNSISI
ncbi:Lipoxygenase 6, chloroplastic [Linum perenne]